MSGVKILSCDEYLEDARNNAQKEMKDHEIVARTDRSWVCKTKGENNFWFEAVVVSAGSLLVHGDISCVLFSQCRYKDPESVLRWMGMTNDLCYYVMQKATIGMNGGPELLESFNAGVWWHEALRHLEDVLDDSAKYENVRTRPDFSDIKDLVPEWLFEIVSEGPSESGEVGSFDSRAYDAGVHGWGRVPSYRLIHAHEATRKLCQLLDKEKADLELKKAEEAGDGG